jgi:hypothetical protein
MIIREPILHFWSVLGGAFAPKLTHKEEDCFCENGEEDSSLIGVPHLPTIHRWEEYYSDDEPDFEDEPPALRSSRGVLEGLELEEVELPQTWTHLLIGRLLI